MLVVENLPANVGEIRDESLIPGLKIPLEEGTEIHSSIFAWRIPWTEELGELWSITSQRVRHYWSDLVSTHTDSQHSSQCCVNLVCLVFFLSLNSYMKCAMIISTYSWRNWCSETLTSSKLHSKWDETEPKSISASPHTVHTYIFLLDVHFGVKKKKWRRGCRFFSEFHSGFLKNGGPHRFQVRIRLIFRTHPFRYFWKLRETI